MKTNYRWVGPVGALTLFGGALAVACGSSDADTSPDAPAGGNGGVGGGAPGGKGGQDVGGKGGNNAGGTGGKGGGAGNGSQDRIKSVAEFCEVACTEVAKCDLGNNTLTKEECLPPCNREPGFLRIPSAAALRPEMFDLMADCMEQGEGWCANGNGVQLVARLGMCQLKLLNETECSAAGDKFCADVTAAPQCDEVGNPNFACKFVSILTDDAIKSLTTCLDRTKYECKDGLVTACINEALGITR